MSRRRFGDLVKDLGKAASARPSSMNPGKVAARQEHADAVRRYADGGRSKGEALGFGATSPAAAIPALVPVSQPPPVLDPEGTCAYCRARVDDMSGDAIAASVNGEPRVWCGEPCLAAWTENQ